MRGHHAFEACVEQLATAIRLGVYPRGTHAAGRARAGRAARRSPGRPCARRWPRCGRPGWSRPPAAAAAARSSRSSPARRRPRAAARITAGPAPDWLDALDYRRIVEPGAAALAASRELDDVRLAQLEQAHAEVAAARKPAEHRQADSRFHLTVASLTDSPRTIEAVTSVQATLHEMLLAIPVLGTNIAHSDRQHARLVRAILAGKPDRARRVMEEHCDDTAALLRGLVG